MVESEATGLTEEEMLDAVKFGHEGCSSNRDYRGTCKRM